MNNYYALIYLTDHLNHKLKKSFYQFSISPHRNVWEGYFENPDGGKLRVILSTTPGEIALFTDIYRPPKKSNVLNFFESLAGYKVDRVELAKNDRLITISLENSTDLLFQLFGNKANLFQTVDEEIIESFKRKNEMEGQRVPQPRKPEERGAPPDSLSVKQLLLHYDQKFPRHLIDPVIEYYQLNHADTEKVKKVTQTLTDAMKNRAAFRVLTNGNLCLIPDDLLPLENLKVFTNINDAVKFAYYKASSLRRFEKRIQSIRPKLEKKLKKANRAINQLENADKALKRAQQYEEYGHLLMAHAHEELDPTAKSITVPDLYNENQPVEVELKENLSIADNAKYYYDRSAKAKRRVEESKRRKKEIRTEIRTLEQLLDSLNIVHNLIELDNWEKEHKNKLEDLDILSGDKQPVSNPFRINKYDGYEIWIGKNAKSNDELTKRAHKEDIWLHARGTGGSHVVIRMNNQPEKPPKHIIHNAASFAAWHSGLRGSNLVPVIYTKKKYVTKPKGAPAGTVRVHHEEVVMVSPKKPSPG